MASQLKILAGTVVDDSSVGTIAWNDPDNAKVEDGNNAYVIAGVSHYLKATNFGFVIPTGATINGILVEVKKLAIITVSVDNSVKIVKSDGSLGNQQKAIVANWSSSQSYVSYGSASDLWNETWTPTDINNSNFGFVISVNSGTYSSIDYISITVYYTEATPVVVTAHSNQQKNIPSLMIPFSVRAERIKAMEDKRLKDIKDKIKKAKDEKDKEETDRLQKELEEVEIEIKLSNKLLKQIDDEVKKSEKEYKDFIKNRKT